MATFQKMSVSITVRMTPQQQQLIRRAADEMGMTAGDFMRVCALERAKEVLAPPAVHVDPSLDVEDTVDAVELGSATWFFVDELGEHIPCCRDCGTGPLEHEHVQDGRCYECRASHQTKKETQDATEDDAS